MATPQQRAIMTNTTEPVARHAIRPAKLQKNIRCLGLLWTEWTHGLQGAKAAKDFTPVERGANSSTYCKRLPIWQLIRHLVNAGVLAPDAIKRIEEVYGPNVSMLELGRRIKQDVKAHRLHHSLQIYTFSILFACVDFVPCA